MSSVINLSQLPHLRLGREELPHKQLLLACMKDSSLGLIPGMGVAARSTFSPLFLPGGTDLPLGSPIPPGPSYNSPGTFPISVFHPNSQVKDQALPLPRCGS